MRIAACVCVLGMMVAAAHAQAGPPSMELPRPVPTTLPNQSPKYAGVTYGQPVTAIRTRDSVRVLGDGTKIEHHTALFFCRDSAGRVRNDTMPEALPGKENVSDLVSTLVSDPDKHIELRWNNRSKVATLRHVPPHPPASIVTKKAKPLEPGEKRVVWIGPAGQRQRMESSYMPAKTIEGLETRGSHVVKFVPEGKEGNDHDLVSTVDSWYQPELRLALLTDISDPMMGHTVYAFSKINRAEPPATLFAVPPGYTIRELPDREPAKPNVAEPDVAEPDPALPEAALTAAFNPQSPVEVTPAPIPAIRVPRTQPLGIVASVSGGRVTPPLLLSSRQAEYPTPHSRPKSGAR